MTWFRCLLLQASMHDTCDLTADRPWELFVVLDTPPSMVDRIKSVKDGDPDKDLVIGIATFANNSSWDDGERCGIVFISSIRDWIEDIVSLEVIPPYEISQIILSTRGFMELKNDLSILEELQSDGYLTLCSRYRRECHTQKLWSSIFQNHRELRSEKIGVFLKAKHVFLHLWCRCKSIVGVWFSSPRHLLSVPNFNGSRSATFSWSPKSILLPRISGVR